MSTKQQYYIMGSGALGKYLKDFFSKNSDMQFAGFIDNRAESKNIYKPNSVKNKKAKVFIGSINYMYEMFLQLKSLGFSNIVSFAELTLQYQELQNYNQAFLGLREDYQNNKKEYENLRNILEDDESKKVLDTIIEFRKTYDINLYSNIAQDIEYQYFESFMPHNIETFIDGGGFDGDTVQRMLKHNFKPNKIYFFEPDLISFNRAKENLKNISSIEYFSCGLSNRKKILKFNSNGDFGSHFSNEGDTLVQCLALDDVVKEDKAYIKLDVEGAESDAINGAKRILQNGSPFAICVYHKPSDIWKIPKTLIEILGNLKYKFYLRHYTNSIFDTIFYGVPVDD